jgi:hypothetical protein
VWHVKICATVQVHERVQIVLHVPSLYHVPLPPTRKKHRVRKPSHDSGGYMLAAPPYHPVLPPNKISFFWFFPAHFVFEQCRTDASVSGPHWFPPPGPCHHFHHCPPKQSTWLQPRHTHLAQVCALAVPVSSPLPTHWQKLTHHSASMLRFAKRCPTWTRIVWMQPLMT